MGARVLPEAWAPQVAEVVRFFLDHGWGVGSGGARGADQYTLEAVVAAGRVASARSMVFLPGPLVGAPSLALRAFAALGGRVVPGAGHTFEEPGALGGVAEHAVHWLERHALVRGTRRTAWGRTKQSGQTRFN